MTYPSLEYKLGSKDVETMATITSITIRRSVKISTGQYENTDTSVELSANVQPTEDPLDVAGFLINTADNILRKKIDDIELGKREIKSKASRFGV